MATIEKTMFTPPELAAMTGRDLETIHAWIRSGELLAMNAATKVGQRPRYLVSLEDWEIFKRSRMVAPQSTPPKSTRRRRPEVVRDFFQ